MPLYMVQFSYTAEAWAALARNPEDRSEAVRGLAQSMGGRLVSFHYSFGDYDGVLVRKQRLCSGSQPDGPVQRYSNGRCGARLR